MPRVAFRQDRERTTGLHGPLGLDGLEECLDTFRLGCRPAGIAAVLTYGTGLYLQA